MSLITHDGLVHRLPSKAQADVTTSCGRTDTVHATPERVTCDTCRDTDICPRCGQRVGLDVLIGRVRTVTTTVPHVANQQLCHYIYKTEEKR